jgi:hypothetical protein
MAMTQFPPRTTRSSCFLAFALVVSIAGPALLSRPAAAQLSSSELTPTCAQWELEYSITGSLRITGTATGAGDGTFPVGPGTLVLRIDARAAGVSLMGFQLHERFSIHPTAMMWNAIIVTDVAARASSDGAGAVALGTRTGDGIVRWAGPLSAYRSDGVLTCDGSLCGKFGAPTAGRNDLHQVSRTVRLQPLRFDHDGQVFRMDAALVSSSESPRQRTYLALSGRRTTKRCVAPAPVDVSGAGATGDPHAVH